ncbi:hypothetical protein KAR34_02820 [bacterium]|nr:hypothetical protein [bacterium]
MNYKSQAKRELLGFWHLFTKLVYKNAVTTEKTEIGKQWIAMAKRNTVLSQLIEISEKPDQNPEQKWEQVRLMVATL